MDEFDDALLAEVLHRVLGPRAPRGLTPDREGWVELYDVCLLASEMMRTRVSVEQIAAVGRRLRRFEVRETRIRLVARPFLPPVPDILFHATSEEHLAQVRDHGALATGQRRRLFLSEDESQAWRVAHRFSTRPRLIVVDAARARRSGVRFQRARQPGLFSASPIPLRHLLNLREGYGEQWSAGGIPVSLFPDGLVRMALVQVTRRSGTTWEVAKGKLEPAESPEDAAVREVQEEMGVTVPLRILRHVGDIRYGFVAPGGAPRLKTVFLYLMTVEGPITSFSPATGEGIGQVRWFTPDEAIRAVTHTSLQPLMWKARDLLARYGLSAPAADGSE